MLLQIASEAFVVYFVVLYLILFLAFSGTPLLISGYEAWIASIMYFVIRLIWLWRNKRGEFGVTGILLSLKTVLSSHRL